ncbi:phosphodiesterase [Pseudomonas viridiflava]|nr:phosphodiesterase [Pseudomonas viridiflava]
MKILSHRGYWNDPNEKNSRTAFKRSLELGFGLETDIRDCAGRLVVSHDMPTGHELGFEQLLAMLQGKSLPLALNIKADGMVDSIRRALQAHEVQDWFVFDMSVPDMRSYLDAGLPVFARVSEVEREPPWAREVTGIWLDSFSGADYDTNQIARFLGDGKRVCVVSPELHNRPHQHLWKALESLRDNAELMLCTDYPELARKFLSD